MAFWNSDRPQNIENGISEEFNHMARDYDGCVGRGFSRVTPLAPVFSSISLMPPHEEHHALKANDTR